MPASSSVGFYQQRWAVDKISGKRKILLWQDGLVMVREIETEDAFLEPCYDSKSLYFDELYVAKKISSMKNPPVIDKKRVERWISRYCQSKAISLSDEQAAAVRGIVCKHFSILTGGPGCGKTTTTLVLVKLLEAMKLKVLLAAPTGRAAQRMIDVIGKESKTIHRLLVWQVGNFNKNEEKPLDVDFLIVDEYYEGIVRQLYKPTESCPVFSDTQSPIWALAKY